MLLYLFKYGGNYNMIFLHYNKISNELKNAILNRTLTQEDLEGLKSLLDDSYPIYSKAKKKANFFGLTTLLSFIIILLIIF